MANFAIKLVMKGFDALKRAENSLNRMTAKQKEFNSLVKNTSLDKITGLKDKFQGLNKSIKSLGGLSGVFKMIKLNVMALGAAVKTFTVSLISSPALPVIIAIGAAVLTVVATFKALKRIVALNVGGIKGSLLKAFTSIKLVMAKIRLGMDRLFMKMAPTFKIIGKSVEFLGKIMVGIMKEIWPIWEGAASSIIDSFNQIYTSVWDVLKVFGLTNSEGKLMTNMVKGFVNVAVAPMVFFSKVLKVVASTISVIVDGFKKLVNYVKGSEVLQKLFGFESSDLKEKAMGNKNTESMKRQERANLGNVNNRTVTQNNNNNVAIHTSSPISQDTAPHFGNILVNSLGQSQKVGL